MRRGDGETRRIEEGHVESCAVFSVSPRLTFYASVVLLLTAYCSLLGDMTLGATLRIGT